MTDNGIHNDSINNNGEYDRVTAADIAEFLHHLAQLRCGINGLGPVDPAERAAFLTHKAALFTRIADQAERARVDSYSQQVRQLAADTARTAATEQAQLQLPQQQVGPTPRRTSNATPITGGSTTEENSGASSG